MITVAGLAFEIGPEHRLLPAERAALRKLAGGAVAAQPSEGFVIELADTPPWTSADPGLFRDRAPAAVRCVEGVVRLSHRRFVADIDPAAGRVRLFRDSDDAYPLEITLRTAVSCLLPYAGGVPLHAAGAVIDGRGWAFFGPSGAGKSTLAASSPHPVLSDELVAVSAGPARLWGCGFWGELEGPVAPCGDVPLAALVELARGPGFALQRLGRAAAYRRLLNVLLVPGVPQAWGLAMARLRGLVAETPVYRMEWSPQDPPWARLRRLGENEPLPERDVAAAAEGRRAAERGVTT